VHLRAGLRGLAAASAIAVAAATLSPTPAASAPVFFLAGVDGDAFAHDDGPECTATETSSAPAAEPLEENGPTVTYSGTGSATFQNDTVAGDTASVVTTGTTTSRITSVGLTLGSVDLHAQGTGTMTTALATSDCLIHAGVGANTSFGFTVAEPGWLIVEGDVTKHAYLSFSLTTPDDSYAQDYAYNFTQSSTKRIFLTPGLYAGAGDVFLDVVGSSTKSFAGEARLHVEFARAGAQSEAPSGVGRRFVGLAARSCATNAISAAVTSHEKRADRINSVTFFVNDKKVLSDANPQRGEVYSLPVQVTDTAEVTAVAKLKKPKPNKAARIKEVTSTYLPCS
jgi:hypothetical protein